MSRWLTGRMTGRKLHRAFSAPLPSSRLGARPGGSPIVTMPSAFPHATNRARPEPPRCHIVAVLTASMSHRGGLPTARMRRQLSQVPRSPHGTLAVCCQTSVHVAGIHRRLRRADETCSSRPTGSRCRTGPAAGRQRPARRLRREPARASSGCAPATPGDWLIVAGDVAETVADIEWALRLLSGRVRARDLGAGQPRAVDAPAATRSSCAARPVTSAWCELCRELGVLTPEDPYPVWTGAGGPVTVAPAVPAVRLHVPPGRRRTKEEALDLAYGRGRGLHRRAAAAPRPVPEPGGVVPRPASTATRRRLGGCDPALPDGAGQPLPAGPRADPGPALPAVRAVVRHRRRPRTGTSAFRAATVVYGHLHIPRTTCHDGVRFEEVSVGYPCEQDRPRTARATRARSCRPAPRGLSGHHPQMVVCTRRGGSSAGQSSGLIIRRSWVRAPPAPPAVLS